MCGIFGSISERNLNIDKCIKSLELLSHRGPDNKSYTINLDSHLFLGHTRLKIIDLSNSANQPFISNCGNYEIIFNGEIFNYKELIDKKLSYKSIIGGECSAPGIISLICACNNPKLKKALKLNEKSNVLLIGCEGNADMKLYKQLLSKGRKN